MTVANTNSIKKSLEKRMRFRDKGDVDGTISMMDTISLIGKKKKHEL